MVVWLHVFSWVTKWKYDGKKLPMTARKKHRDGGKGLGTRCSKPALLNGFITRGFGEAEIGVLQLHTSPGKNFASTEFI
jgi:hypothetical protein